jgi:hypothetical protein
MAFGPDAVVLSWPAVCIKALTFAWDPSPYISAVGRLTSFGSLAMWPDLRSSSAEATKIARKCVLAFP